MNLTHVQQINIQPNLAETYTSTSGSRGVLGVSRHPQAMEGVLDPLVSVANIMVKEHVYMPTGTSVNVKTDESAAS